MAHQSKLRRMYTASMMFAGARVAPYALIGDSICLRCWARSSILPLMKSQRAFSSSKHTLALAQPVSSQHRISRREYFSANGILEKAKSQTYSPIWPAGDIEKKEGAVTEPVKASHTGNSLSDPPAVYVPQNHQVSDLLDRRKKHHTQAAEATLEVAHSIPHDASAQLAALSTSLPSTSLRRRLTILLSLSKPRLTFLMVLTTATAYSLYPVPAVLLPSTTASPSLSALTLVFLTSGTALCSASANALNMLMEPKYDAMMSRTRNRPLVRGLITKRGAFLFAGLTAALGTSGLYFGVNPTVAFLGGLNIFLYAGIYTPLKRLSVLNTWAGAIVGSIPPLMGWAAAAGQSATGAGDWKELLLGTDNVGGWLLAALLFAWQFPHFNALSWTIREEYKNAGYRMLAWTNTRMNGRVALRYSLMFFPICFGLTWYGVTDRGFVLTSAVVNAWMVREAWRFWRKVGRGGSARGLFWASVWHLPIVMVLAMAHKKGLWEGIWRRVIGEEDEGWVNDMDGLEEDEVETIGLQPAEPLRSTAI